LEPADVKGPLAQFQATRATKEDVLKLLQTLNQGLQEGALPDAHIDEVFDVWWPKLESDFENLPPDQTSANARPHRSERDLLEEILDFVRNQSRLASPQLTEDDRVKLIEGRAYKALWSVPHVSSLSCRLKGTDVAITVQRRGRSSIELTIPKDTALDEVAAKAKAQIPPADWERTTPPDAVAGDEEDQADEED
jgi:hypothetical protein